MANVERLLSRFDKALGKKNNSNRVDFKELKARREKATLKLTSGKNQLAFLVPKGAEDPFTFWGYHSGLQETSYWQVACNEYNSNGDDSCLVCSVVADLKKDYEKNKGLWYPIRQQIEVWAPVINLENDATIAQGPKWVRISKSAFSQITEWIKNLEEDEEPFFSHNEPSKVIITYNSSAAPADQYKLDRKNMKAFGEQQLEDWMGVIEPLKTFMQPKSAPEIQKIVDGYFARIAETLEEETENTESDEEVSNETVVTPEIKKVSRLDALKSKKG